MPAELKRFNDEQQRQLCSILRIGCDRETACNYLGKTARELNTELELNPVFKKEVLHAEATSEFTHMRNLYNASRDEKQWRASVWWLERQSPERYARRAPDSVTAPQLRQFVEELAEAIVGEVNDSADQHRLLMRLVAIAEKLQGDAFDAGGNAHASPTPRDAPSLEVDQDGGAQENL